MCFFRTRRSCHALRPKQPRLGAVSGGVVSLVDRSSAEACFLSRHGQRLSGFLEWHHQGAALIVSLLLRGRPSAISGFVVPIDINPVEAGPLGPGPHVFDERLEAVQPSLTHDDAAPSIDSIMSVLRLCATALRVAPRLVLWRNALGLVSRREAMRAEPRCVQLATEAVTACRFAFQQRIAVHFPRTTAITLTQFVPGTRGIGTDHDQAPKSPSNIQVCHSLIIGYLLWCDHYLTARLA